MTHTQILKEYSPKELEELSKNYQLVSVQDSNGKKIIPWTPSSKTIKQHLADCFKRLQMEINPDGFYFFCFAQNRRATVDNYDKYLVKKGNPKPEALNTLSEQKPPIQSNNDVLSFTSALGYITKIAELTSEVNTLKAENQRLKDENAVLDAECEEMSKGLSDEGKSDTVNFLKEAQPGIMSALDQYFNLQERKLSLQERTLGKGTLKKVIIKRKPVQNFEIGSNEHLDYIRKLYNDKQLEIMDKEIDKLENTYPEQYDLICKELNLFEDENGN